MPTPDSSDEAKRVAAESAVARVRDGMVVGLGSGSTASIAIERLAERVRSGLRISGIATSGKSEALARSLGIPIVTFAERPRIDLTIDGADEVEPGTLNLIKGKGGALLREKIIAAVSAELIIAVDESKITGRLGAGGELPVEVIPFGYQGTAQRLRELGFEPTLRVAANGTPFLSDGGHYILDCSFSTADSIANAARELDGVIGLVEHGIFAGMATEVHCGSSSGVKIYRRSGFDGGAKDIAYDVAPE